MAVLYSTELAGVTSQPQTMPNPPYGGKVRCYTATITLATQTTSDTIVIAKDVPAGSRFLYGIITSTVSLGSSVISVGVTGTTAKYRAAAAFTAVETPTLFGLTTAMDDAVLATSEDVFITIATASLPGSGTLCVHMYYAST